MGIPTQITIQGTVRNATGPLSGRLVFAWDTLVRDNNSDDVMTPDEIVALVGDDGELSVEVPATDDPGFSPTGWTMEVRPHFEGWKTPFHVSIPYDSTDGIINLSDLVEVPPDGEGDLYALVNHTHEGGGGGGDILPSSTVVAETSYGASSSAGNASTYSRGNHTHGTPALPTAAAIGAATSAHNHDGSYSATGHTHTGTYDPAGTASSAVSAHSADTTDVHGIADTSVLATDAEVTSAIATHAADTTSVHGIADTSVLATDAEVASAISTHEAASDPHPRYTSIYYWNGSSYDLVNAAAVYVGGTGPASPVNGDVHFPSP